MKKILLIFFLLLCVSCKQGSKIMRESTSCNIESINDLEQKIISDLKESLGTPNYQNTLKEIEKLWIKSETLESDNDSGYYNLLKSVKENGFSDNLVTTINSIKQQKPPLQIHGLITTIQKFEKDLEVIPNECSLKCILLLYRNLKSSSSIYSTKVSEFLIQNINYNDLDKQFYQDFIILFYISIL